MSKGSHNDKEAERKAKLVEQDGTLEKEKAFNLVQEGGQKHNTQTQQEQLVKNTQNMLGRLSGDSVKTLREIIEMFEMHWKKKYTISNPALICFTGCLFYVVSPIDLIPDATPLFGLVDDATMIHTTAFKFSSEFIRFRRWKESCPETFKSGKEKRCCDCVLL